MSTGSDVADQFVAATAARLPNGAADSAHRAADRRAATITRDEWRLAQVLAERAALRWTARALKVAGEEVESQALGNLPMVQATYLAKLVDDEYSELLGKGSEAEICCRETVAALDSAVGLTGITDRDQLREPARHAGHALAACFLAGGVTSIPDEVGETLALLANEPLPPQTVAWE
jgi:hypothetical protein